jgi:hypothetical protein
MIELLTALFAASVSPSETGIPVFTANNALLKNIVNIVLVAIGGLSLFYIIRAGLLFVTSNGNPNDVKQARTTILVAVGAFIGATAVFGLVNFVIANVGGNN